MHFANKPIEDWLSQQPSEAVLEPELPIVDPHLHLWDIRTATIIEAEKVPKANKLLKIELDLGFEKRTVVSGIAKSYKPEDIVGKQVTVLCNLAPRKIRGVLS